MPTSFSKATASRERAAAGGPPQVEETPSMFRKQLIPVALATVMVLGSTVGAVYAGSDDNAKEMTALRNAKISLAQASTGAEQKSGGKAISAGLNNENG